VAEEAVLVHGSQVLQFERDRKLLQGAIAKLQGELDDARRAQEVLDDQKQENVSSSSLPLSTILMIVTRSSCSRRRSIDSVSTWMNCVQSVASPASSTIQLQSLASSRVWGASSPPWTRRVRRRRMSRISS
jgi:hypothetical protein